MSGADLPASLGAPRPPAGPPERGPAPGGAGGAGDGQDDPPGNALERLSSAFTGWAERWIPDAFVFALLATVLVVAAAALTGGAGPGEIVGFWGDGFWELLPFTLQMALIIITGYVLATTGPVYRGIAWLAARPSSPRGAVAMVALFAMLSSWLNWGFSLIFSAMLAREVARRVRGLDYRAAAAASFLGLGSVWAQGLSGSAALQMASPAALPASVRAIVEHGGAVPGGMISLSHTIFLWQSLASVAVEVVIVTTVMYFATPLPSRARTAESLGIDLGPSPLDRGDPPSRGTPGEWLEHSRVLSLAVAALASAYLVRHFLGGKGVAGITLNIINLAFLTLGVLLHGTPARLMRAFREATPGVWGVILQFPFYAGVAAVITKTHLSATIAHWFVSVSSPRSFPALIAVYSAALGVFVPSGGSKWVIEAPYVMAAAHELRVHVGWMVAVYDLGEALANLVQPFWMLPILGLFGLRARDVMGYTFLVFVVLAPVVLALVTALGATLPYPLLPATPGEPIMSDQDATRVRPGRVVRHAKLRATITRGPDAGLSIDIAGAPVRVGTSAANDLVLTDDSVSRRHCEIEPLPEGLRVRDMGSTNGVSVGGIRLYDALLPHGTTVLLGDSELKITALSETVAREQAQADRFGDLLGRSGRMRELFADLERIAPADVTLLVEGETGTGKDLVAESVHARSARAEGPFVVFDCAAVAPSLVESELFGHEKGAFTGASSARPGVFEQAEGGTLFIDELGELPRELQPKLLRALEKRQIRRVGGARTLSVDARVIAATNRNLRHEVARGNFREDLYFRVALAHVVAPPLRDRMEDLPLLVEHFLSLERPARGIEQVPSHVWDMFRSHRWPGNVRELRNAVARLGLTPERPLRADLPVGVGAAGLHLAPAGGELLALQEARRQASDAFELAYLQAALARSGGNVTRAAALAGVSRQMMQKLMRKHAVGEGRQG
jgi:short-chain fatty acids transporter